MGLGLSLPLWLQGHCLLASCEVPQPRFLLERGSPSPGAACMTPAGGPGRARTAVFACRVLREPEAGVTERELPGACVHAAGRRAVCCLRGQAGGRSVSGGPGARMPMAVTPFLQSELTVLPEDLGEREKCQGRREDAPRHSAATFPRGGAPRRGRRVSPRARGRRVRRRCRASRQRRRPAPPPGEAPCALRVPGSAPTTACPLGTAAWTPWGGIKHVPTLVQSSPRPPTELATLQSEAPPPPGPGPGPHPPAAVLAASAPV